MHILHLFPDTNLFIQCRPLEELDWSIWAEFEEVHLVVCRPVQREIDNQKARGSDRIGKWARKIYSLFREIIINNDNYKTIRETGPRVILLVEPLWVPSRTLTDRLGYLKTDDEIVGCVHAYKESHPGSDVRLLTHDSGPTASARMLSLPFAPIPDAWLLQPENNKAERTIQQLQTELERLNKTEPQFAISCLDYQENTIDSLKFEWPIYKPLTENELSAAMDCLKKRFPLTTDFGTREPNKYEPETIANSLFGIKKFIAASDEEITTYTETSYPAWIEKCRNIL